MTKRDRIAELGRQEHEEREQRLQKKRKLRGFKKPDGIPRSIRAHRYAAPPDGDVGATDTEDKTA